MAASYNTFRAQFRVTVNGGMLSICLKGNGVEVIRSRTINNADISLLSAYVEDLEKVIIKYQKAASDSMGNRRML